MVVRNLRVAFSWHVGFVGQPHLTMVTIFYINKKKLIKPVRNRTCTLRFYFWGGKPWLFDKEYY
jgi:hypothetical protein